MPSGDRCRGSARAGETNACLGIQGLPRVAQARALVTRTTPPADPGPFLLGTARRAALPTTPPSSRCPGAMPKDVTAAPAPPLAFSPTPHAALGQVTRPGRQQVSDRWGWGHREGTSEGPGFRQPPAGPEARQMAAEPVVPQPGLRFVPSLNISTVEGPSPAARGTP